MPQIEPTRTSNHASLVLVIVCALMIVGIGGAVVFWKALPKTEVLTTQQALDQANDKIFSSDYDGARKILENQLPKAKTTDEKVRLYINIGVAYARQENYAKALEAFKSARSLKETYGTIKSVADMAKLANDKSLALSSYKQLEARIKSGADKAQAMDLSLIQENIASLEKAQ